MEQLEDRTLPSRGLSFAPPVDYPTGAVPPFAQLNAATPLTGIGAFDNLINPMSIAQADFNGDGRPDVVAVNTAAGTISGFLNDPLRPGTFLPPVPYEVGGTPFYVAVGYFDSAHPNIPGVAVAVASDGVAVLSADPNGTGVLGSYQGGVFVPGLTDIIPVQGFPTTLAVGHFAGSGKNEDIAVGTSTGVTILLGNGQGGFTAGPTFAVPNPQTPGGTTAPGGVNTVAAGDFNNDGLDDLAVTVGNPSGDGGGRDGFPGQVNEFPGHVLIYLNHGGSFGKGLAADGSNQPDFGPIEVGAAPYGIAVGDWNDDGITDLAVSNGGFRWESSTVSILTGQGDGNFVNTQTVEVGGGPYSIAVGHFGPGKAPDLVTANWIGSTITVLQNDDGVFHALPDFWAGESPTGVAVADFNGDGRMDVVVGANHSVYSLDRISVLMNNSPQPGDGVGVSQGIDYYGGTDADVLHTLDVYQPPTRTTFPGANAGAGAPVLLFLTGSTARKRQYSLLFDSLGRAGVVVVAANYHNTLTDNWPQPLLDAAQALKWTAQNIGAYGGDPGNIFLWGHRFGQLLTSLLGTEASEGDPLHLGIPPSLIRGVIATPQPEFDLTDSNVKGNIAGFDPSQSAVYSPTSYINKKQPPFLMLTPADTGEPPQLQTWLQQAEEFFTKSTAAGAQVAWDIVAARDQFNLPALAARPDDAARQAILSFIGQHLSSSPPAAARSSMGLLLNGPDGTSVSLTLGGTAFSLLGQLAAGAAPPAVPTTVTEAFSLTIAVGSSTVQASGSATLTLAPAPGAAQALGTGALAELKGEQAAADQAFALAEAAAPGAADAAALALGQQAADAVFADLEQQLAAWLPKL